MERKRKPKGYCYKCNKKLLSPVWITCNDCSRPKKQPKIIPVLKPVKKIIPEHLKFGNFNPYYIFDMRYVGDKYFTYQSTVLQNEIESRNDIKRLVVDNINRIIGYQVVR